MKTKAIRWAVLAALFALTATRAGYCQSSGFIWLSDVKTFKSKPLQPLGDLTVKSKKYERGYTMAYYVTEFQLGGRFQTFEVDVALTDQTPTGRHTNLQVIVDGQEVRDIVLQAFEEPKTLKVDVKGKQRLGFELRSMSMTEYVAFLNPRLLTGPPGPTKTGPTGPETPQPPECFSPFAVDPRDLDTLAENMAKNLERKPELKQRVANGKVALATFDLISIPCKAVATDVREDLSTGLINNDFNLVERGQLDKIFKELKIQDSGAIDPETAKKLGKLTGCDLILVGSISDRGNFVAINARILDTETGQAVTAVRQEMRKTEIARQ